MKKNFKLIIYGIIVSMLVQTMVLAETAQKEIHIAVNGSDMTGDGSFGNPYATLSKGAERASRLAISGNAVNVYIHQGEYDMKSFYMTTAYSGVSTDKPITYTAYGNDKVIFTDAKSVNCRLFSNVTDPKILERLPKESRSKILELELDGNVDAVPYLYVNGEEKDLSRYPKHGLATVSNADGDSVFTIDRAVLWVDEYKVKFTSDAQAMPYLWSSSYVQNINEAGEITVSVNVPDGARFVAENILSELNVPGEYCYAENMLYYYPENDFAGSDIKILREGMSSFIGMTDVSNVNFKNITFEKHNGSVFNMKDCQNIDIIDCDFNNIQTANYIININNGKDIDILRNNAYECESGFVYYSGGDFAAQTNGNIKISDNFISDCGKITKGYDAIIESGISSFGTENRNNVGNEITNNVIQNCWSCYAIQIPGNGNKVQYNEIINHNGHNNDGGAIYFGRSAVKYGNDVSYNYIHDLNTDMTYAGVYSDDGYSGINIHHNIFEKIGEGIHSGVGMDNKYNDNVMVNCREGLRIGSRMLNWKDSNLDTSLYNEVSEVVANYDAVNAKYPQLAEALARKPFFAPWNTEVLGNVFYNVEKPFAQKPIHKASVSTEEEKALADYNSSTYMDYSNILNITKYVDEIKLYGAKKEGNFTESGNSAYTENISVSDAGAEKQIDITAIGLVDNTIEENGTALNLMNPVNNEENVRKKVVFKWNSVKNASKYVLTVSENADLSAPVISETLMSGFESTNSYVADLENSKTYYWKVEAKMLARQNEFEAGSNVESFTVCDSNYVDLSSFQYALNLIRNELDMIDKNIVVYNDETAKESILSTYDEVSKLYADNTDKADEAENKIYSVLKEAEKYRTITDMQLNECRLENNSSIVKLLGSGAGKLGKVSVLVTNPLYELESKEVQKGLNIKAIQYSDTLCADNDGVFEVSFDTKVNDIDMPGVYRVYITNENGLKCNGTYYYGTYEAGNVIFKDSLNAEISADTFYTHPSETINWTCEFTNRTNSDITPLAVIAFYNKDKVLINAVIENDTIIPKNGKGIIGGEITIPEIFDKDSKVKIFFWERENALKPLTTVKEFVKVKI